MPPVFRHGKASKLLVSSIDASSLFQEVTASISVDAAEVTTFNSGGDKSFVSGQRVGTISASGFLDASTAGANDPYARFRNALGSSTDLIFTAIPGGPGGSTITPGSLARLGAGVVTSFETAAPALGVVTAKFDAQVNNRFDVGRTLYGPGAAKTSTFAGTAVDSGVVSSTAGGVAHFHLLQSSGAVTALVMKVQHSSLGSAWADLVSSSGLIATPGAKRSTVSGTIKRYTRATITTITGGASKSVKISVSFARRGAIR